MADTVVLESPAGPVSMTFTPGTTAPLSSVTWPRRLTVWANAGKATRLMATKKRNQLTYVILAAVSEDFLKVRPYDPCYAQSKRCLRGTAVLSSTWTTTADCCSSRDLRGCSLTARSLS